MTRSSVVLFKFHKSNEDVIVLITQMGEQKLSGLGPPVQAHLGSQQQACVWSLARECAPLYLHPLHLHAMVLLSWGHCRLVQSYSSSQGFMVESSVEFGSWICKDWCLSSLVLIFVWPWSNNFFNHQVFFISAMRIILFLFHHED